MPKTNYSKVEELLAAGLLKMMCDQLLEMTADKKKETAAEIATHEGLHATDKEMTHQHILEALHKDLKRLMKKDVAIWKSLDISKSEMNKYIKDPHNLSSDDWKKLKRIRQQVDTYKKELSLPLEEGMDEKIIQSERKKHKNKRFNVREGWLPLT